MGLISVYKVKGLQIYIVSNMSTYHGRGHPGVDSYLVGQDLLQPSHTSMGVILGMKTSTFTSCLGPTTIDSIDSIDSMDNSILNGSHRWSFHWLALGTDHL